jgi:lipopolysaccharide/colanic/teichoic acid biosynthesis glycosyltransferase
MNQETTMPGRSTSRAVLGKTWIERLRERASALWPADPQSESGGLPASAAGNPALTRLTPLEAVIVAERMRSDRTGDQFCAVVFRPRSAGSDESRRLTREEAALGVLRILEPRVRATDVIGVVARGSIGVVLPHTAVDGATVFARAIVAEAAHSGLDLSYGVYPYPQTVEGLPRDDRAGASPPATDSGDAADRGGIVHRTSPAGSRRDVYSIADLMPAFRPPLWKRAVDVLGAVVGIVCLAPAFVILGVYIKVVSRGPVFLRQERIGLQGRPFRMWKLRTMHADADSRVHMKHVLAMIEDHGDGERPMRKLDRGDPRIIPGGLWLRRLSVDELPQLLNVLQGEMSLVGPRPEMPYAFAAYRPWHARRFNVLPGMTGLWQVSGKNRTTFQEMIRLDIKYGRALEPRQDIAILARTLPVVLAADNGSERPAAAPLLGAPRRVWGRSMLEQGVTP